MGLHRVVRVSVRSDGLGRCSICGDYAEIKKSTGARHVTRAKALANAGFCTVCGGSGQVGEMPADCPECGLNPIPGRKT